jgi:hypothetical protein
MRGLDPRIHALGPFHRKKDVDGRVKPGHGDGRKFDLVIARSASDEAIQSSVCCNVWTGLLRFARNDGDSAFLR